jgi:hypothetical protein
LRGFGTGAADAFSGGPEARLIRRESAGDDVGVTVDDGELVVELMGDSSGEAADAFQALGLAEAQLGGAAGLFRVEPRGDIGKRNDGGVGEGFAGTKDAL